jgi:hypothetical protein
MDCVKIRRHQHAASDQGYGTDPAALLVAGVLWMSLNVAGVLAMSLDNARSKTYWLPVAKDPTHG